MFRLILLFYTVKYIVGPYYFGNRTAYCILVWNLNAVYFLASGRACLPITFDVDPVHLLLAPTTGR